VKFIATLRCLISEITNKNNYAYPEQSYKK